MILGLLLLYIIVKDCGLLLEYFSDRKFEKLKRELEAEKYK